MSLQSKSIRDFDFLWAILARSLYVLWTRPRTHPDRSEWLQILQRATVRQGYRGAIATTRVIQDAVFAREAAKVGFDGAMHAGSSLRTLLTCGVTR
jgi:hypothetical protein